MGLSGLLAVLLGLQVARGAQVGARLGPERAVFQTSHGDLVFGFYPQLAPQTVPHIVALIKTGAYYSNHFFRVDKGFVAQVADVRSGRMVPLTAQQATYAAATVPLEVTAGTSHVPGTLSMARHDDPNSGGSSFSVLLGNAPHLDMKYTIFGQLLAGMGALEEMQQVETIKEGIFVMPKERVDIYSTMIYYVVDPKQNPDAKAWAFDLCDGGGDGAADLRTQIVLMTRDLQIARERCLPS